MKFWQKFWLIPILTIFCGSNVAAFGDVAPNDPNEHMFQHLHDVGVMHGFADGNFHTEKIVTRAEALAISLRAGGIAIPAEFDGTVPFNDIDPNSWFAPVVARAAALEMVSTSSPLFRPNDAITKSEFLAFLFRATQVDYRPFLFAKKGIAEDVTEEDWFALAFAYAKKYQVAHLPADNLYRPYKYLSRYEVALMTFRQLRLFHGDRTTREFLELQAKIQQFMTLLRAGKDTEAQTQLPRILELTDRLALQRNNESAVAAQALSRSLKHLVTSIRAFKFEQTLTGLENLFLASRYAQRAEEKSEKLAPFARDIQQIVRESLDELTQPEKFRVN